jgi:hypothetical protein
LRSAAVDALGRKRFEASHSKSDKSADATFDPAAAGLRFVFAPGKTKQPPTTSARVPKCHIRIRTSLQMQHEALKGCFFQGPFSVVSRPNFPTNAHFFEIFQKKLQKKIKRNFKKN